MEPGKTPSLPPKLAELLREADSLREETVRIVRSAGGAPSEDGAWSAAELLEHLLLAETGAGKVVRKVLRESGGALPPYPDDDSGIAVRRPFSFDGMESPPVARPTGALSPDDLPARAAEVRAATRETIAMLASVDPRAGEFPHHRFGSLNLYEWLAVVILEHEKGHRAQLLAAAGRPS
jgi:hypothetical protein